MTCCIALGNRTRMFLSEGLASTRLVKLSGHPWNQPD